MLGLFTDIGPYVLKDGAQSFTENIYTWNQRANVMFIDQPAGVGYSIGKTPEALRSDDIKSQQDNLTTLV